MLSPASAAGLYVLLAAAQSMIMIVSAEQSQPQHVLCADSSRYISRFGLTCEMHRKLHCDSFAHIGFSPAEVLELYSACPIACQREECLGEYDAVYDSSANGSIFSCEDDQTYTSPFSMKCIDHASIDCEQLMALGMQPHEMEELLDACPRSCDVPLAGCSSTTPVKKVDNNSPEVEEAVIFSEESNTNDLGGACFVGWEETCQDNSDYLSPMGLGCAESFGKVNCLKLSMVGFTEIQMLEALQSCPCTCGVECGYSMPPSGIPTVSPSDTPSTMPSSSPSAHPSANPSVSPTDMPSYSPSQSPSSMPSSSPTKSPTSSPSDSPSVSPTASPTQSPTSVPSFVPSSSPTHRPSSSPSSAPTSAPSSRPTTSSMPSSSPTSVPSSEPSNRPSVTPSNVPSLSQAPSSAPTVTASQSPSSEPTKRPSSSPSAIPTQFPTRRPSHSPSATPSSAPTDVCVTYGWKNQCSDDPDFRSALGFACPHHSVLICTDLHHVDLSAKEIDALIEACPCSCQIECGTWGGTPTASPTTTFVHAHEIGVVQTNSPSEQPTTAAPSKAPTTNKPTERPSKGPITASPTVLPMPVSQAPTSQAPIFQTPTLKPTAFEPTSISVITVSSSPTIGMSALLRGSNTADPKKEQFAFASTHQEEQNATYEKSTKDTSLLAIIIIGVFAGVGSIEAVLYLRKRKNDSKEEDAVMNEEVEVSSPYEDNAEMELPAGKSSDSRDSSAYLNTNDAAPFPNRLSNSSPNDAIEADVHHVSQEMKGLSASYADEKEQCCKPTCFGWGDLENSLGFKSPSSPPSTAVPPTIDQMDEIEEESASNVELPPPVRHEDDAGYAFMAEASRDISAARMDPRTSMLNERSAGNREDPNMGIDQMDEVSNVELPPPVRHEDDAGYAFMAEASRDISAARMDPRTSMLNERSVGNCEDPNMGIDNEFLSSTQHYMSDDSDDDVGEFDEVSTDNGCSASADSRRLFGDSSSASTALVYGAVLFGDSSSTGTTSSYALEELNNQRRTSPSRMSIDNEIRKKFARRGLQTISSRGGI